MWASEVEYIDLEKGEKGLGFSILDYQVMYLLIVDKHIQLLITLSQSYLGSVLNFLFFFSVSRHVHFFWA